MEAWLVRKMAGLDWKSDSAATVIHPFLKGNGRIHLNGTGGVKFQKPGSIFGIGFQPMIIGKMPMPRGSGFLLLKIVSSKQ
ncbi:MAG: hypothetical protein DME31_01085 [Verrucomicrobia bacterium]|nr:MAG: hypothetical protein DME31_01085 [Verrucomicrobiota bacterium]PYL31340.1 MAG: hypothetical protein DMF39_03355 [Verrucomicrobiota bacterium]